MRACVRMCVCVRACVCLLTEYFVLITDNTGVLTMMFMLKQVLFSFSDVSIVSSV